MIKSIKSILSTDKEKYKVPKKVQDVIPIKRIWPDGIFLVGNKFVKSYYCGYQGTTRSGYGNNPVHCQKAYVPDGRTEVSAVGRP